MKRAIWMALGTGAVLSSAVAALGLGPAGDMQPLTHAQHRLLLEEIALDRDAAIELCAQLKGHSGDLCRVQADAEQRARAAQAEASLLRTPEAARAAQRARIEARYSVARARCAALGGHARDNCLIEAHALKGRALLDAQSPYERGRSS